MGGRPSATAELIALATVFLSRDPRLGRFVQQRSSALAELLLSESAPAKLALIRLAARPGLRGVVRCIERAVLPGILLHYTLRKRFIEESARAFFERGGGQLVVLGAGFDTLATRVAEERPGVVCVEVDHPGTQEMKRRALTARTTAAVHLVPADLARDSLGDAVASVPRFAPGHPTFYVLEGVSMYLDEASVARILGDCARLGGPGTRIAWTFMTPDERGRIAFRRSRTGLVDSWLQARGEPFTWGIRRERLDSFLSPLRLAVSEVAGPATLRDRYLSPLGIQAVLAEGEECVLCERT
jgi:methyltransferase (TIGR00027 family)